MKKLLFLVYILLINLSCGISKKIESTKNDSKDLVGIATKADLLKEPFKEWFLYNYNEYQINEEVVKKLKPLLDNVTIKTFIGTWCGDSQEQTPVFFKILDNSNFNYNNLSLITLNKKRQTIDNLQKGYNIIRVPTLIFYKNEKEIGRIVEYPRESIEKDILKIISGAPYKHSYQD